MTNPHNISTAIVDVFISHSSKDLGIAKALVELLKESFNLPAESIRLTSVHGHKLPPGPFFDRMRTEVTKAKLLIGIITDKSMRSAYVLFELGARWGVDHQMILLVASAAGPKILPGPLFAHHALRCNNVGDIHLLVSSIGKSLGRTHDSPAAYQEKIDILVRVSKKAIRARTAFGAIRRVIVIAVLVLIFFGGLYLLRRLSSSPTLIEISDPPNKSWVTTSPTISGTSRNIPDGKLIWIYVYSNARSHYRPEDSPAILRADGGWSSHALIGSDEPLGNKFEIIAVLVDASDQKLIQSNANQQSVFEGLPPGATVYSQIEVTTK